jgi:hypothetical protein
MWKYVWKLPIGLRAGWSGVRIPAGAGNFSPHRRVQTGSGAHPVSYPVDTGALSLGVKRPGREVYHSHLVPRSRMRGAVPPLPQYTFTAWYSVKSTEATLPLPLHPLLNGNKFLLFHFCHRANWYYARTLVYIPDVRGTNIDFTIDYLAEVFVFFLSLSRWIFKYAATVPMQILTYSTYTIIFDAINFCIWNSVVKFLLHVLSVSSPDIIISCRNVRSPFTRYARETCAKQHVYKCNTCWGTNLKSP